MIVGWSPAQSSYFNTVSQFLSSLSARGLVLPFMARQGNRKAFENGCLIAMLAYIGCALSWLPQDVGGSKRRHAMQYGGSVILLQAWPAACLHSIRALIVKQGIEVTTAVSDPLSVPSLPQRSESDPTVSHIKCIDRGLKHGFPRNLKWILGEG